jgi:hypothetical protein
MDTNDNSPGSFRQIFGDKYVPAARKIFDALIYSSLSERRNNDLTRLDEAKNPGRKAGVVAVLRGYASNFIKRTKMNTEESIVYLRMLLMYHVLKSDKKNAAVSYFVIHID